MLSLNLRDERRLAMKTATHYYFHPHPLLRPYIAHYTIIVPREAPMPETLTLIPDASGCIVFHFNGKNLNGVLWGPTTKTVIVKNNFNTVPMRIFVEFLPGAISRFLGISLSDLSDKQIPLYLVHPKIERGIIEAFEKNTDLDGFFQEIDILFLKAIKEIPGFSNFKPALEMINYHHGKLSVKELSQETFYSERHLNRIFQNCIGMNVKTYSRLLRVNFLIEQIRDDSTSFSLLAQAFGYYDQPHLIHDFKMICGTTPKKYLNNMSVFYNEIFKF